MTDIHVNQSQNILQGIQQGKGHSMQPNSGQNMQQGYGINTQYHPQGQ